LKPFNPIAEIKGIGKSVFRDQSSIRKNPRRILTQFDEKYGGFS
jgi:hypothetical protein